MLLLSMHDQSLVLVSFHIFEYAKSMFTKMLISSSLLRGLNYHRMVSTILTRTRSHQASQSSHGLVRPITVRTCIDLYPRLHQLNPSLYPHSGPSEGIDLTVNYVDTAPNQPTVKTILAIPGAGGNYTHFDRLISHYNRDGSRVRVIAPNLPDFSHTRANGLFWHSTREKVAFLKDFLKQIGVDKIDCAVGHSLAIFAFLWLLDDPGTISIKSLALLSPQALYDMNPFHNAFASQLFTLKSEEWFNFLSEIGLHKTNLSPAKFDNINDYLLLASSILDTYKSRQKDLPRLISKFSQGNPTGGIPIAIVYGSEDKFVLSNSRMRLFLDFGLEEEEVVSVFPEVDRPEMVVPKSDDNWKRIQGYIIEGGGHFAHASYETFTYAIVNNLMGYVEEDERNLKDSQEKTPNYGSIFDEK